MEEIIPKKVTILHKTSGFGGYPPENATIHVHFVGSILEDKEGIYDPPQTFLDTRTQITPFSFTIGKEQTIPGLDMAMRKIKEGEHCIITCSSDYCFGHFGNPQGFHSMGKPIPPHACLQFDLELIAFDIPNDQENESQSLKEVVENVALLKSEANRIFQQKFFESALFKYKKGVEMLEKHFTTLNEEGKSLLVTCLLNAAACKMHKKDYMSVVSFSSKALDIDPSNFKGLLRRGKAYSFLNETERAKEDLLAAQQITNTPEIQRELQKLDQKIREHKKKEKSVYKGIFNKLNEEKGIYEDYFPEPEKAKCSVCGEEMDAVQLARHVIKKHSGKQPISSLIRIGQLFF